MSSVMSHAHRHDAIHQDALRDDFAAGARRPEHSRSARRASAKRSTYFFASSASNLSKCASEDRWAIADLPLPGHASSGSMGSVTWVAGLAVVLFATKA
jgi:hypothetical protein